MSKQEDGGAAFPSPGVVMDDGRGNEYQQGAYEGMSLRDYFAAKALPGMMTAIMADECHNWEPGDFAKEAYKIADAMLAERDKCQPH